MPSLKSLLVRVVGWPMPLLHGDTGVMDRWVWLRQRLGYDKTSAPPRLLDLGCGSGAFTIGAARMGYDALGLSSDDRNMEVARERAQYCGATSVRFENCDLRHLSARKDLHGKFDVILLFEVLEHVVDDEKLLREAVKCLKPGGRLLFTAPNFDMVPIDPEHAGPFPEVENGHHVRRGYRPEDLHRLGKAVGLEPGEISYCMGWASQAVTRLYFQLSTRIHHTVGWLAIHPLRPAAMLDPILPKWVDWPPYSICWEARKPLGSSLKS
jgi:SAM-dependent methyltransferase